MTHDIYHGPHLHAVIACLDAGREDNARSWIERDLRECGYEADDMPMPGTLWRSGNSIVYRTVRECTQCVGGDGI